MRRAGSEMRARRSRPLRVWMRASPAIDLPALARGSSRNCRADVPVTLVFNKIDLTGAPAQAR